MVVLDLGLPLVHIVGEAELYFRSTNEAGIGGEVRAVRVFSFIKLKSCDYSYPYSAKLLLLESSSDISMGIAESVI